MFSFCFSNTQMFCVKVISPFENLNQSYLLFERYLNTKRKQMKLKTKQEILVVAVALYCSCLLVSNVIAGKTFAFFSWQLPCAVVIFPLVYIIGDMLTEIYGFKTARKVVFLGFGINLLAVIAYSITIVLPPSQFFSEQAGFEAVLSSTPRMLLASFSAYIVGSLINAKVMDVLHQKLPKFLMLRCIVSTLLGESADAAIFISIAFAGTMPIEALITMIVLQAGFKTLYEIIIYPITKAVITKVKALP